MSARVSILALVLSLSARASADAAPDPTKLGHDIYQELIEANTTQSSGDTYKAAQAMAARLITAGFATKDVQTFEVAPRRGNLVARLRGTGKRKPLLLVAHLDVVEAKREDWSTDPFKLVEKNGYYYGRGTSDDKAMAAVWVANLCRWKQEGYRPDRDLILVLETDEEIADVNSLGIRWLIKNHPELIRAELALNEGGDVGTKDGKPVWNTIQTSEKLYQSFWLEVRNVGGHSSLPRKDNAIYELAAGLSRLESFAFPLELNETTRAYFEKLSATETGQVAADMKAVLAVKPDPAAVARLSEQATYNAQMRTTCVATRLEGGHADNALPQLARAMLNCRILPGKRVEDVQSTLERVLADSKIVVTATAKDTASPPSPFHKELFAAVEKLTTKYWPTATVLPRMGAGATDGRFLRNAKIPTYGHSGLAADIFDVREHGKDERVLVRAFETEQQYTYELVKLLAGGQ